MFITLDLAEGIAVGRSFAIFVLTRAVLGILSWSRFLLGVFLAIVLAITDLFCA